MKYKSKRMLDLVAKREANVLSIWNSKKDTHSQHEITMEAEKRGYCSVSTAVLIIKKHKAKILETTLNN